MRGKLIVIDGVDGCGKQTQTALLVGALKARGYKVKAVTFPNYESESSYLVREYLNGNFGDTASSVNPKVCSTFYTVDRYSSYYGKGGWKQYLDDGYIIVADRYTTSNMVHQCAKYDTEEEKAEYIQWLKDYEYGFYGLPVPDIVMYLVMDVQHTAELTKDRVLKVGGVQDIHEQDRAFMQKSYDNALYVAKKEGWHCIECIKQDEIRPITDIHNECLQYVLQQIEETYAYDSRTEE